MILVDRLTFILEIDTLEIQSVIWSQPYTMNILMVNEIFFFAMITAYTHTHIHKDITYKFHRISYV